MTWLLLFLSLTITPAEAKRSAGAFVLGSWVEVQADAALAQQLARDVIQRKGRWKLIRVAERLEPKELPRQGVINDAANARFREGFTAYTNELYPLARKRFEATVEVLEGSASSMRDLHPLVRAWQYAGLTFIAEGRYREGIRCFHRAVVLAPGDAAPSSGWDAGSRALYQRVRQRTTGAGSADVRVLSNPLGAAVLLDGRFAGVTPAVVTVPVAGRHHLVVEKDGFRRYGEFVEVLTGPTDEVLAELIPAAVARLLQENLRAAVAGVAPSSTSVMAPMPLMEQLGLKVVVLGQISPRGDSHLVLEAGTYDRKKGRWIHRGAVALERQSEAMPEEMARFFVRLLAGNPGVDPKIALLPPPPAVVGDVGGALLEADGSGGSVTSWVVAGAGLAVVGGVGTAWWMSRQPPAKPERRGELLIGF